MHESEEYTDLIRSSSHIVTTSLQCALEAKISGANVVFIYNSPILECVKSLLETYNINIVDDYNQNLVCQSLSKETKIETIIPTNSAYDSFLTN